MPFVMVTRETWGSASKGDPGVPIEHPVMWLNLAHLCLEFAVPTQEIIRELQRQDILAGRTDIQPKNIWRSLPISDPGEPIKHPVMWLNLSHFGEDFKEPTDETVRQLQKQDLLAGKTDIQPNFLIADDGTVYEGRGWLFQPGNAMDHVGKEGQFLDITFLGNLQKVGDNMDHPVYNSLQKLLSIGVNNQYLSGEGRFLQTGQEDDDEVPRRLGFHGMPFSLFGLLPPSECQEEVERPKVKEDDFGTK